MYSTSSAMCCGKALYKYLCVILWQTDVTLYIKIYKKKLYKISLTQVAQAEGEFSVRKSFWKL